MSSCGAGGQFVISVHCLLQSQRFGRDSSVMSNKIFQTLVQARRTVVFPASQCVLCTVVTGVTCTSLCFCWAVSRADYSAALVWCCAFGPLVRSVMEDEVRRGSRVLSPATDSEDSFDSRHAQHHRKDVRFSERPLLDSHSR